MPDLWRDRVDAVAGAFGIEPRRLLAVAALVAFVLVGGTGFAVYRAVANASGPPPELSLPRATRGDTASSAPGVVVVAAAGAVVKPGVYRVDAGARVIDVVAAAGGASAEADLDQVNLAAKVGDGERVYVPRRGEAPPPVVTGGTSGGSAGSADAGVVDLNTATLAQLEALPGVGPATAQAILDYRTKKGRFRSVDELLEVRGIGEAKLEQLRPHVRV